MEADKSNSLSYIDDGYSSDSHRKFSKKNLSPFRFDKKDLPLVSKLVSKKKGK
jgi:hypothetical protein